MTLRGEQGTHPEPTYPHSPEAAAGTSSVGGPPAHFDTLARLLSVDPELVPAALANLIASERESAVSEFVGLAAVAMGGVGSHRDPCRLPDTSCLCGVCDFRAEAATKIRDLANTT